MFVPALRAKFQTAREAAKSSGIPQRLELKSFLRSVLYVVSAALVGLDGVDDSVLDLYFGLMEQLSIGSNVEWVVEDHRAALANAQPSKQVFLDRFFEPSWKRRQALVERCEAGELPESDLPVDLITLMIRNRSHFEKWGQEVFVAEAILFHGGAVNSLMNSIIHAFDELSQWLASHLGHEAAVTDRQFLRLCCNETLRLHPPSPFLIRRAVRDASVPTGARFAAGEYVVLDVTAASRDPQAFGEDAGSFEPYRFRAAGVKPNGVSFGDGPHTCIGMSMTVGVGQGGGASEPSDPAGIMVATLRELLSEGLSPDRDRDPDMTGVNVRDEFAAYWVVRQQPNTTDSRWTGWT